MMRYDLYVANRKRRIIFLLRAAAECSDPPALIDQVLRVRDMWDEIGDAGHEADELAEAYIRAKTRFWMRVDAIQRESAKAAA